MQVIFECIRYKNFLAVGNYFQEVNLTEYDRVLFVGDNGAGKTTVIEAIHFALFGKAYSKKKKPQLVNNINKKGTVVEIEFSVGTNQYMVRRCIGPDNFEIFKNKTLEPKLSTVKEYQTHLEKSILFLNPKSFKQFGILGSARYNKFMDLEAADRREIIEDLLDSDVFSRMNVLLKSKLSDLKLKITNNDNDMLMVDQKLQIQLNHFDEMVNKRKEKLSQFKEEKIKTNECITNLNKGLSEQREELIKLEKKLPDVEAFTKKKDKIQDSVRNNEFSINALQKDISFFSSNEECPTCKQDISEKYKTGITIKWKDDLVSFEGKRKKLNEMVEYAASAIKQISIIQQSISVINNKIMESIGKINTQMQLLERIDDQIKDYEKENDEESLKIEIEKLREEKAKYSTEKNALMQQKEIMNVSALLLKDSGIKSTIIKKYIPLINKYINQYLSSMDFYCNFELDEQFNETIKQRHRNLFTYDSFSEGQKARIDLAILFTWRMISKLRNKMNINILFMDETFDSSLDGAGTEELLGILDSLKDLNIFIISHRDEMKEKFNNTIKFKLTNNFSRIVTDGV